MEPQILYPAKDLVARQLQPIEQEKREHSSVGDKLADRLLALWHRQHDRKKQRDHKQTHHRIE